MNNSFPAPQTCQSPPGNCLSLSTLRQYTHDTDFFFSSLCVFRASVLLYSDCTFGCPFSTAPYTGLSIVSAQITNTSLSTLSGSTFPFYTPSPRQPRFSFRGEYEIYLANSHQHPQPGFRFYGPPFQHELRPRHSLFQLSKRVPQKDDSGICPAVYLSPPPTYEIHRFVRKALTR